MEISKFEKVIYLPIFSLGNDQINSQNGELNKLRRKILSDYLNLCQSKADKFNSYKNKFKYSDEKIKEFFFTKK